jgi:hypothetical protein
LRASIEALLQANAGATGFLEQLAVSAGTLDHPGAERPGTIIKHFGLAVDPRHCPDARVSSAGCDLMLVSVFIDVSHRTSQQFTDRSDRFLCSCHRLAASHA